jgi:phage-related protein
MSCRASATAERSPARTATDRARATRAQPHHTGLVATDSERIALPHRELLEERFGRPLDTIEVYASPRVAGALGGMHAVSATRGDQIFLAGPSAPLSVVAHEVAHALQAGMTQSGRRADSGEAVEPVGSVAEREASDLATEVSRPALPGARVSVGEGLGRNTLALLRMPSHRNGDDITLGAPSATPATPAQPAVMAAPAPTMAEPAATSSPLTSAPAAAATGGPAAETETSGGFQLAPAAELSVDAEQVAARETAMAAVETALSGATTPTALLQAYAAAPPTVKARQAGSLEADVAGVAATEGRQWQSDVPDLHASLDGAEPPAAQVPVLAPPVRPVEPADTAVAPAPEPQIPDVEVHGPFDAGGDAASAFNRFSEPDPAVLATQIGDSLDSVQTSDPAVPRSPGPPPPIPLGGETDPARVAEVESAGRAQAAGVKDEAVRAVIAGQGPERIQPAALDEAYPVGELPAPLIGTGAVPEGPAAYMAMELPPEVQVTFDEQQHAAMEKSMAETVVQSEQATSDRDTAKETAVAEAEAGVARLNEEADGNQSAAVLDGRTDIQTARQDTVDAQQAEVERVGAEAGEQRRIDEAAIKTRVADDQKKIDSSFATAEADIGDKVAEGERQAKAKKDEAERKAEDESWWDQAVSFVKEAFNSLVDAIGTVFDAVRSAVNDILDAVKAAALAAIDAVAGFIKDAIAAYGELLKSAITGLIGEIFPELAATLNAAIDTAVAAAQSAVDVVANGLKAGVSALVDGLRAGLMAIIDAYQAAVTLALSVAAAVITGDWGALALRVLEAVLRLIGVDPEQFYAFVGRAQETFQMIVDNPAGFLGNLLAAVGGGIQRFADNIVTHLQTGVIGWLTGALGGAGIVLPKTFDLLGVLDLARQILGLTWDLLKAKARKLIGEQNVERLQVVFGFIETLVTEGWGALWDKIMESVSTVFDMVFDGIKNFIRDRVIIAAITKLASLFSPVGAIVQLVLTAWNIYTFLRDQLARMVEVVQTVTNAIGDIARGVLDNAKAAVEAVLARLLPLAIDLLARVIGLGNVGAKVKEIIEKVRAMVDKGIDTMLQRIAAAFKGGGNAAASSATAGRPAAGGTDSALPESETITEQVSVAGEDHTLRAVVAAGSATIEMASGNFSALSPKIKALAAALTDKYLDPAKSTFVGSAKAPATTKVLTAIVKRADKLTADLSAALPPSGASADVKKEAAKKESNLVKSAFTSVHTLLTSLGLPNATATGLVLGHGPKPGPVDNYGRRQSFLIDPLTVESLAYGGKATGKVPGLNILKGKYQRGHLVAGSLGGPGGPENLVPQSPKANTTRVGMQATEDSLRYALHNTTEYIFRYQVSVKDGYKGPADLEADLAKHGLEAIGGGDPLFLMGAAAKDATPDDTALRTSVRPNPTSGGGPPPPMTAREDQQLPDNLRRRLAFFFLPNQLEIAVQVHHEPTDRRFVFAIHTGGTVDNHEGVDTRWH